MFKPGTLAYHEPMRIVCPSCAARYEVSDSRISPGKAVKCAQCGTRWAPRPAVPTWAPPGLRSVPAAPEIPVPPAAEPPVVPSPVSPVVSPVVPPAIEPASTEAKVVRIKPPLAPAPPSGSLARVGWLLTILFLAGLSYTAITRRTAVIEAWPPSERGYLALGLR